MTAQLNLNRRHRTPNTNITIANRIDPVEGPLQKITLQVNTGVDFGGGGGGGGGGAPSGLTLKGGEICLAPLVLWYVIPTWQQEIQNSGLRLNQNAVKILFFWYSPEFGGKIQIFRAEIKLVCGEDFFLGLHPKLRTEIELYSSNKLCKNISPPWNLLNPQKTDAYASKCI